MYSPALGANHAPEIKGYRIKQYVRNEQELTDVQQTLLKVTVKNQSNGIPKIRNDVICNEKHYPFVPLFTFTSEDDLKIIEQISTIVLRDENEILCEILTGKINEVRASQFKDLKSRFKSIFSLDLKIDPEELFLILISNEITKQSEFNDILDSISEFQFVNVLNKIYENCPSRVIPKILRKFTKYFNSTKGRPIKSIERLQKILKVIKSTDQATELEQKEETEVKLLQKNEKNQDQQWVAMPKNTKKVSNKKQNTFQSSKITQGEEELLEKVSQNQQTPKKAVDIQAKPTQSEKISKKVTEIQKVKKTEKITKKQKIIKTPKQSIVEKKKENQSQNEENWQDVGESEGTDEEQNIKSSLGKMAFHADDSDENLKYLGPKKKNKKNKNNFNIHLDPEVQIGLGKKPAHLKKQKKNNLQSNSNFNLTNQGKPRKTQPEEEEQTFDRRNYYGKQNNRSKNGENEKNNNQQSTEKGRREFSKENKKLDTRILLGINGASDAAWREKMRPPRYINNQSNTFEKNRTESTKENRQASQSKKIKEQQKTKTGLKEDFSQKQTEKSEVIQQQSKNLSLQKIFSIPDDSKDGKQFKFQKRDYNLFVNKLFWVNISGNQVTVQKDGKGYIRKCQVEIIDNGKAIMAEGLTINTDGLSNLQDGGTSFGNPVFEEFTPDGQWFHIRSLDVFTYV